MGDLKQNPNKDMIPPSGVTFKFIVTPSISDYHKKGKGHFIITKSGVNKYFRNIEVTFYDGCCIDNQGRSFTE